MHKGVQILLLHALTHELEYLNALRSWEPAFALALQVICTSEHIGLQECLWIHLVGGGDVPRDALACW